MSKNNIDTVLGLIGNTPLVDFSNVLTLQNFNLFAKLEYYNPGFSIKDRMVAYIIQQAENSAAITPDTTIVEASSGNTAAAIAMIAAIKGYKAVITVPDTTSAEKIKSARVYGAEVILCPANVSSDHPDYYVNRAAAIAQEIPASFTLNQYDNQQNALAHYNTTGPEIWRQCNGGITHLVACASTGGTISGVGKYLKEQNKDIKIITIDPPGSVFYSYHQTGNPVAQPGTTCLEGAGKKYIPGSINFSYIDKVIPITDSEAIDACQLAAKRLGVLLGGSGGAALAACLKMPYAMTSSDQVVMIAPDSGIKYLSTIYDK